MDQLKDAMEKRPKSFTAVRLFTDQVETLDRLVIEKWHNNRSRADLIRDAVDQYMQRERFTP